MRVKLIGELNREVTNACYQVFHIINVENSIKEYFVLFYNKGRNEICIYKFSIITLDADADLNLEIDKRMSSQESWDYEFIYLVSVNLSFPIYFVVQSDDKIWAIGHDEIFDLKPHLSEAIKKKSSIRKRKSDETSPVNFVEMSNISKMSYTLKCIMPINVNTQKKMVVNNSPICFVEKVLDKCLLLCHVNTLHGNWIIQAIMSDGRLISVSRIPFHCDTSKYLVKKELCNSGFDEYIEDHKAILKFIQAEGIEEFLTDTCTLNTQSFVSFFGAGTLLCSRAVILFGSPNGKVLWHPLLFQNQNVSTSNSDFYILYDIEQPIKDIHVCSESGEKLGGNHDSILILGAFGKVAFLSSQKCEMHKQEEKTFQVFISYISTPVYKHIMINTSIYHTSANGEMWVSDLSESISDCCCKCKVYQSVSTGCYGVTQLKNLVGHKEFILFETVDGYLYLGQLFEEEKITNSDINFSKQFPHVLEACYQTSRQLYHLENVESKQKKLMSLLSNLSALKVYGAWEKNISCSIQETKNRTILLSFSLSFFKKFDIEPNLFHLSASISRCFKQKSTCHKKYWSCGHDHGTYFWEIDSSVWSFSSGLNFPWTLEMGLNFDMPKDWKQSVHLQIIEGIPQYFKIITYVIHEFLFIKWEDGTSCQAVSQLSKNNVFLFIKKLYDAKLISMCSELKTGENLKLSHSLPSACILQLSNSIVQIFEKMKGCLPSCSILEHLACPINARVSTDQEVVCFGFPVKLAVIQNDKVLLLKIDTNKFSLLVGLKFALMYLAMIQVFESSKNLPLVRFTVSEHFQTKVEVLSRMINKLLVESELLPTLCSEENLYNMYRMLRSEISSKVFL